jgi:hypothetical protein
MNSFDPKQIISFRAEVPYVDHEKVSSKMRLHESETELVGPPLAVRNRKLRENIGPYREVWSIVLSRLPEVDINIGLIQSIQWLSLRENTLIELKSQNVATELYISLWYQDKLGFTISNEQSNFLGRFGINVLFDCYLEKLIPSAF